MHSLKDLNSTGNISSSLVTLSVCLEHVTVAASSYLLIVGHLARSAWCGLGCLDAK